MNLRDLSKPFFPNDIEWRIVRSGFRNEKLWALAVAYCTSRAVQNRLDEVCGPENWQNKYKTGPAGGVICGISIKVGDEWVTKWDGADNTQIESVKGGLSGAMKRAGAQWGIGRYLYGLPEAFVQIDKAGTQNGYDKKSGTRFKWHIPRLPEWALPQADPGRSEGQEIELSEEQEKELSDLKDAIYGLGESGADINATLLKLGLFWPPSTPEEALSIHDTALEAMGVAK